MKKWIFPDLYNISGILSNDGKKKVKNNFANTLVADYTASPPFHQ